MPETESFDSSDSIDSETEWFDPREIPQVATFDNEHPVYVVRSLGPGGFDEVTRPDSRSADEAAEVHERATGNATETEVRFE